MHHTYCGMGYPDRSKMATPGTGFTIHESLIVFIDDFTPSSETGFVTFKRTTLCISSLDSIAICSIIPPTDLKEVRQCHVVERERERRLRNISLRNDENAIVTRRS